METRRDGAEFPVLEHPPEDYRYRESLDHESIDRVFSRIEFVRHVKTPYKEEGRFGRLTRIDQRAVARQCH